MYEEWGSKFFWIWKFVIVSRFPIVEFGILNFYFDGNRAGKVPFHSKNKKSKLILVKDRWDYINTNEIVMAKQIKLLIFTFLVVKLRIKNVNPIFKATQTLTFKTKKY